MATVENHYPSPESRTEGHTVYIKIQDSGIGVDPNVIDKIFDPFFTTKDVGKGSGLGLFVTHSIIEEHDGSITAESMIGHGTSFLIRLPQTQTASKEDIE
jgi:signal transduction histidine kinase